MPFSKGKIFKNHLQAFGHWIRVRVRAYLRVPDLHAPYLTLVLTGYEPHSQLTLPSILVLTSLHKRIALQIYPNCLHQSLDLGNSQFPFPIGSFTSSILKKDC